MVIAHYCETVPTLVPTFVLTFLLTFLPTFSPHSPHILPTFIMRLYKQIKTTCGTLTISNHSKSLYLYIKLLASKILSILVSEATIITAVATYTLKVKIKKLPFLGNKFSPCFSAT